MPISKFNVYIIVVYSIIIIIINNTILDRLKCLNMYYTILKEDKS